jgi:hypothetical protein
VAQRDGRRDWLELLEPKAALVAPIEKPAAGLRVRRAAVYVADVGGEEFEETPGRLLAGARNFGRQAV